MGNSFPAAVLTIGKAGSVQSLYTSEALHFRENSRAKQAMETIFTVPSPESECAAQKSAASDDFVAASVPILSHGSDLCNPVPEEPGEMPPGAFSAF